MPFQDPRHDGNGNWPTLHPHPVRNSMMPFWTPNKSGARSQLLPSSAMGGMLSAILSWLSNRLRDSPPSAQAIHLFRPSSVLFSAALCRARIVSSANGWTSPTVCSAQKGPLNNSQRFAWWSYRTASLLHAVKNSASPPHSAPECAHEYHRPKRGRSPYPASRATRTAPASAPAGGLVVSVVADRRCPFATPPSLTLSDYRHVRASLIDSGS